MKLARQLKCDVNSKQFRDALRFVWMPRLMERINASTGGSSNDQTTFCSNTQAHSDSCVMANPQMLLEVSSYSSGVENVQPPSLSESSVSYNLMGGAGSNNWSPDSAEMGQFNYSDNMQAFEPGNGFGGADNLWTDENIWFLQQQLADDI